MSEQEPEGDGWIALYGFVMLLLVVTLCSGIVYGLVTGTPPR